MDKKMKQPKADYYQEKPLAPAEEHYLLVIDLLERKKAEILASEEEVEIREWIKELWEKMSLEERAVELLKAPALREQYGDIL